VFSGILFMESNGIKRFSPARAGGLPFQRSARVASEYSSYWVRFFAFPALLRQLSKWINYF